ncbi:hypothetical protein F4818DRAFT_302099 [Hypoxylon cercidicola]|nr:hypothetical protein F4818DRAFT_302099 [Hypoxylon cercidicola]
MAELDLQSPDRSHASHRHRGTCRTACTRCKTRKQRCDGQLPTCRNCVKARARCDLISIRGDNAGGTGLAVSRQRLDSNMLPAPPTWGASYVSSLENRVAELELQLAHVQPKEKQQQEKAPPSVAATGTESEMSPSSSLGDALNVLPLGPFGFLPASSGWSAGMALALNLGEIVQASVWNKAICGVAHNGRSSTLVEQPRPHTGGGQPGTGGHHVLDPEYIRTHSAGPPTYEEGLKLIEAYCDLLHARYPFIDTEEIQDIHRRRESLSATDLHELEPSERFGLFKLYLVYAIGSGLLAAAEKEGLAAPEAYYMAALQHIAAARESRSMENIESMTLMVLFHLRSAVSPGLWYMIGLAMRTCVDLGLHLRRSEVGLDPSVVQHRRHLFWTVYSLERNISIALGHPVSISDRQIDVDLPTVPDESDYRLRRAACLFSLRRIESRIHHSIYRADRSLDSLFGKIDRHYEQLQLWKAELIELSRIVPSPTYLDYPLLHYYRAVRLLLQPFLPRLTITEPYFQAFLDAVGQICRIHKRLHQKLQYGHSFIAVQTIFEAGIIMLYCLWTKSHDIWSVKLSNDIHACTTMLFVMSERATWVRKYRDAYEALVNVTMEQLQQVGKSEAGAGAGSPNNLNLSGIGTGVVRSTDIDAAAGASQAARIPGEPGSFEAGLGHQGPSAFLPPPLQVIHDRWMDFDGSTVVEELTNWVDQEGEDGTPIWARDSEIYYQNL